MTKSKKTLVSETEVSHMVTDMLQNGICTPNGYETQDGCYTHDRVVAFLNPREPGSKILALRCAREIFEEGGISFYQRSSTSERKYYTQKSVDYDPRRGSGCTYRYVSRYFWTEWEDTGCLPICHLTEEGKEFIKQYAW